MVVENADVVEQVEVLACKRISDQFKWQGRVACQQKMG